MEFTASSAGEPSLLDQPTGVSPASCPARSHSIYRQAEEPDRFIPMPHQTGPALPAGTMATD